MKITLPWPPARLSPNARLHWAVLAKAKKAYRYVCFLQARAQGATPLTAEKLHLTITFVPPTRRQYDLDNALARMKSGLDGLADALKVDDKHWTLTIQKGEGIGGMVHVEISEITAK